MTRPSKLLMIVACLSAAALLAACGSSASSSSSAAAGASSGSGPAARSKLRACLKAHGITLPNRPGGFRRGSGPPGGGGSGPPGGGVPGGGFRGGGGGFGGGRFRTNPKLGAAFKACGVKFRIRGRFNPAARKKMINAYVTCVRQHGYQLPKPNFSGKGSVNPAGIEHNAKFQKASQACVSTLRPSGGPGSSSGGSVSSSP